MPHSICWEAVESRKDQHATKRDTSQQTTQASKLLIKSGFRGSRRLQADLQRAQAAADHRAYLLCLTDASYNNHCT